MRKTPQKDTKFLRRNGRATSLLKSRLDEVLEEYVRTVRFWAESRKTQPRDYSIREAYVVGSVLDGNDFSDLDLLLIADKIDGEDFRFIKQVMAKRFFTDRPKIEAVDVFVRQYDEYPDRGSYGITDQVQNVLNRYNRRLQRSRLNENPRS